MKKILLMAIVLTAFGVVAQEAALIEAMPMDETIDSSEWVPTIPQDAMAVLTSSDMPVAPVTDLDVPVEVEAPFESDEVLPVKPMMEVDVLPEPPLESSAEPKLELEPEPVVSEEILKSRYHDFLTGIFYQIIEDARTQGISDEKIEPYARQLAVITDLPEWFDLVRTCFVQEETPEDELMACLATWQAKFYTYAGALSYMLQ